MFYCGYHFICVFASLSATSRQPPMITKFMQKDLTNPEDVTSSFKLPCKASGANLTWIWRHNDKEITNFNGYPYSLSSDGTLNGKFLTSEQDGTYQCFVKDVTTGVEMFSRKLKLAVTGRRESCYNFIIMMMVMMMMHHHHRHHYHH